MTILILWEYLNRSWMIWGNFFFKNYILIDVATMLPYKKFRTYQICSGLESELYKRYFGYKVIWLKPPILNISIFLDKILNFINNYVN